jgi:hypothetical protein
VIAILVGCKNKSAKAGTPISPGTMTGIRIGTVRSSELNLANGCRMSHVKQKCPHNDDNNDYTALGTVINLRNYV